MRYPSGFGLNGLGQSAPYPAPAGWLWVSDASSVNPVGEMWLIPDPAYSAPAPAAPQLIATPAPAPAPMPSPAVTTPAAPQSTSQQTPSAVPGSAPSMSDLDVQSAQFPTFVAAQGGETASASKASWFPLLAIGAALFMG